MFGRAAAAFLLLPGVVGFIVPFCVLRPAGRPFDGIALAPLSIGTILLLWCVRDFYVSGKGTLAPWSPPEHLVAVGPYRWSRNPMYASVSLILLGWAAGYRSMALLVYAAIVMAAFHLRVVIAEEPWLAMTHGEAWQRYRDRVPRWLF